MFTNNNKRKMTKRKHEDVDDVAMVMYEKWNMSALKEIFNARHYALDFNNRQLIEKIYRNIDKKTGILKVSYNFSQYDHEGTGRVYATYGAQMIKGFVKRLCLSQYYHDIDIVNCYPVLLLQLAEKYIDIDFMHLREYVKNRDEILERENLKNGLTCSKKVLKKAFLKILFNGSIDSNLSKCSFLQGFKKDIDQIVDTFWNMNEFDSVKTAVLLNDKKSNKKASFLSILINKIEKEIIDVAIAFCNSNHRRVESYAFDGFLVRKKKNAGEENKNQFDNDFLKALRDAVQNKTGYEVNFIEKPMIITEEDKSMLHAPLNNFIFNRSNRDTVSTMIETLEELAWELNNKEIVTSAVTIFTNRAVEEMNKVIGLLSGVMNTVIERKGYDKDDLVEFVVKPFRQAEKSAWAQVYYIKDEDGEFKKIDLFKLWWNSHRRVVYDSIVLKAASYISTNNCARPNEFNSFVGFAVPPIKAKYTNEEMYFFENDIKSPLRWFLYHLKTIWCNDNEKVFKFVLKWIATNIQLPWVKLQSCIVLQSEPGGGKGVIVNLLERIMGRRYVSRPPSIDSIVGNSFNSSYFKSCMLVFLDEVMWGGDVATKNLIKTKITDDTIQINEKFKESYVLENTMNFIMASNEEHAVNLDIGQRRYLTLKLNDKYATSKTSHNSELQKESRQYFKDLLSTPIDILSNYLNSVVIDDDFLPGNHPPQTTATVDQIVMSFGRPMQFLFAIIDNPSIISSARCSAQEESGCFDDDLKGMYFREMVYEIYKKEYKSNFVSQRRLWNLFEETIEGCSLCNKQQRLYANGEIFIYRGIYFPSLSDARLSFKRKLNLEYLEF